jgi:tol-pal system protein YbgF
MRTRLITTAVALTILSVAAPAVSQTPMIEDPLDKRDAKRVENMEKVVRELRAIVFQLRDTGKPVVVQPADTDTRIEELSTKINDLDQSLRRLNGSVETTAHDLAQAKRDNAALKTQVQTLAEQLAAAEQKLAAAAAPPPAAEAAAGPPPTGDATTSFAAARKLMLAGDYDGAEQAFAAFVAAFPDAPKTAEANYWWGKTLSVRGDHADAAKAYIGAIRGWPQTPWGPDAVVELGRSLVALKKPQDACQIVGELPRHYPKAPAAVTARATAVKTQAKCA